VLFEVDCATQIAYFGNIVLGHKYIQGLQIPVNEALAVHVLQAKADVDE
tara:strand:+ start:51 stop:197 length:147 start_codon:yes stop_codon:yes gene_type:complete